MASEERALYFSLSAPLIGGRSEIDSKTLHRARLGKPLGIDDPALRMTSSGLAMEVWGEIEIPFMHPRINNEGEVILAPSTWTTSPGHALRPIWRKATLAEVTWYHSSRKAFMPTDFTFFGGELYCHILAHFDDLFALFRQLQYHIPDSYLGERFATRGRVFVTAGSLDDVKEMRSLLESARASLHEKGIPLPSRASVESEATVRVAQMLQGKRTTPLVLASRSLAEALGMKATSDLVRSLLETEAQLTQEQLRQGEIVMQTIDNALSVVRMIHKIQNGLNAAFKDLLLLKAKIEEARSNQPGAKELARTAQKADLLWTRLVRLCPFNPYREALFSNRGRGLIRAANNLQEGAILTADNNLREAIGVLRKLVLGERPRRGGATQMRSRAKRAFG